MSTAIPGVSVSSPSSPALSTTSERGDERIDTTVQLVTPERIVFQYTLAGPFRRLMAYLIDVAFLIVLVLGSVLISLLLTLGSPSGFGLILVSYFVLTWGYGAFCEAVFNGRTLGKRVLSIRVLSDQGVPITGAQATLRNLVGVVDKLVPFFFLPGLASMMLTSKFQRLGDLAARTMVVVEAPQPRSGVVRLAEPAIDALLPWLPARVAAGPEMARALSDYVQRRDRFGFALREEMAAPLAQPLRVMLGLPADPSSDAVLCAVYHRVFLGE
ncbi:MAG: RDD family protein [Isosphaeraceae bacterium]